MYQLTNLFRTLARLLTPRPRRQNFYLLTSNLIDRVLAAESFEELDELRGEFHERFKEYATHEDFKDATHAVLAALAARQDELHTINFS